MKKWYLILFLILVTSCGFLKDVSKERTREKVRILETSNEWKKQQGDVIFLPAPKTINKVFRDTVIEVVTDKGSTISTNYNKDGEITSQVVICPDSEETKQVETKEEYDLKKRQVEKEANIEAINAFGKWLAIILIPGQFFFALAWVLRAIIKKPLA